MLSNVKKAKYENVETLCDEPETLLFTSPDGYHFVVVGTDADNNTDPLKAVCLAVKDLTETTSKLFRGAINGKIQISNYPHLAMLMIIDFFDNGECICWGGAAFIGGGALVCFVGDRF